MSDPKKTGVKPLTEIKKVFSSKLGLIKLFSSIYHWFPKFTGRMLDENLGRFHFLISFIGFNLCFAPQHWLGLNGMPRRVAEYSPQFEFVNQISSLGALIMALSTLPFLWNVFHSYFKGTVAGDNPWQGLTPEWLTSSPPPVENWDGPAPLVTKPYGYGAKPKNKPNKTSETTVETEIDRRTE